MIRIRFTVADLARTRLAGTASVLTATTFSATRLTHGPGRSDVERWRRMVRACWRPPVPPLFGALTPTGPRHPLPGFLRPRQGLTSLDEELDRVLSTPRRVLRADLEHVSRYRRLPAWSHDLADGRAVALAPLVDSLRGYHRVAVAPYWQGMHTTLAADRARRARQLRDGGVEAVLDSVHPRMRWRPPVLEVDGVPDIDYDLGGRGLLLAPAAFSTYVPCDPDEEQPTLFYEAAYPGSPGPRGPHADLAALLGHSRSTALQVIAEGVSTGALARRAGLSVSSASQHATVLRRAGLVTTMRKGRTTHHTLTPLGADLLRYAAEPPEARRR